jgi:hypothetical protein
MCEKARRTQLRHNADLLLVRHKERRAWGADRNLWGAARTRILKLMRRSPVSMVM